MEEGWKYFCGFGFACFILLYKLYKLKTKMNTLTVQIFYNLLNHPTFHSAERFCQSSKRKRVICWSIYIIRLCCSVIYLPAVPVDDVLGLGEPVHLTIRLFSCQEFCVPVPLTCLQSLLTMYSALVSLSF